MTSLHSQNHTANETLIDAQIANLTNAQIGQYTTAVQHKQMQQGESLDSPNSLHNHSSKERAPILLRPWPRGARVHNKKAGETQF